MDNLTHSLTGVALSRAGLDRFCPRAMLLMILSANMPDIDAIALLGGQLKSLEVHRGYTHSILCLPLVAIVPVLLTAATTRWRLPWLKAWLLSCVGVASHLLIDLTNNYGIRLWLPFSSRWSFLDLNSLWDGAILAVLLFAAIWPFFGGLVSSEIGDRKTKGRGVAVFALCFFVLYDCGRAVLHNQVLEQLQSRIFNGETPLRTAAFPEPVNPMKWRGVVETRDAYREFALTAYGDFSPDAGEVFYKTALTPGVQSAMKTEAFRFFLYFSRFPVWSEEPSSTGEGDVRRVEVTDLRFGSPGRGGFTAVALEDGQHRVLRSWFGF